MHSRNRQNAESYQIPDMVDSPPHYNKSKIECIVAMEAMASGIETEEDAIEITTHQSYLWQNTFKYLWRWPYKKKPLEDLKKARWYLDRLIQKLEENVNDYS
jgi:hypothetical protein